MSDVMEKLVSLCKRKGFIFQSSEIYGGLNGCWDYGPLGVELLRNIKESWWRAMTYRDDVEGIDASILMHARVWEASGHVEGFNDPMVEDSKTNERFRLDHLLTEAGVDCAGLDFDGMTAKMAELALKSPKGNELTPPRQFNMMFKTHVGPVEDSASVVYLRPETAQGIFVNYLNVQQAMRQKLPFGIAQIGKAFRNEITTKNFLFRTREFEQMEMQYFVRPGEEEKWFDYWKQERRKWFTEALGIPDSRLRWHEHGAGELAHYARQAYDIHFEFPFGWDEVEGIHNRGQFDLGQHEEFSGKQLKYFDEEAKDKVLPAVVETSIGASRSTMMVLANAYDEEEVKGDTRTVMRFHPQIAPIKVAILPLVKRDGMPEIARKVEADLRPHLRVFYDERGAIGRRYRRMDEVGTPFCVTVDSDTLTDDTVTVRERDSMAQDRVKKSELLAVLTGRMADWKHPAA
ncbi:MAG: glycine--tRNA ligase [Gemmatimonadetes bacterium]|jgi:glycyl-tRNA synthetase|nr:glycine--tRNA ligase [Gemmatimonadota bacterium]MBT7863802.1 glycine--tRNA ligase [Gemmatimonadota bacterium]